MITPQYKNPTTGNFEPSPRFVLPTSAVKSAVDAYLAENPISGGITETQINQLKTEITQSVLSAIPSAEGSVC